MTIRKPATRIAIAVALLCVGGTVARAETTAEAARRLAAKYDARLEVRTPDGARCDMLTPTEAIELDWAPDWAEAIGQALYYGLCFDRQPAIILLIADPVKDPRYIARCRAVCQRYDIRLYLEPAASTSHPPGALGSSRSEKTTEH